VVQPDGSIKRKLVCKKMDVPYGGAYKTRKSVQSFVDEILAPINSGLLNPQSTMLVTEFVTKVYLPEYVEKQLRAATQKQYRYVWDTYLEPRMGKLTLRTFRTVHGEQMLAKIAEQFKIGRSSLRHCKAFLSGAFKQAKRLGILDGVNPIQDVSIPRTPEPEETYAYSLAEIKSMLSVLPEPARTIVLTAGLSGLSKGELRGLQWGDFDDRLDNEGKPAGKELSIKRIVWNGVTNDPKTKRRRAPIPVIKQLAEALEAHRLRMGKLAQPNLPIFQGDTGKPLNLDRLALRNITPALSRCTVCHKQERKHKPEGICSSVITRSHNGMVGTHSGVGSPPICTTWRLLIRKFRRSCATATSASRKISTTSR
jgi:integrase